MSMASGSSFAQGRAISQSRYARCIEASVPASPMRVSRLSSVRACSAISGGMPPEIAEHARTELKRLTRMGEAGTEASMQRAYLDWLIALPWAKLDPEAIDISRARLMLDQDHYG